MENCLHSASSNKKCPRMYSQVSDFDLSMYGARKSHGALAIASLLFQNRDVRAKDMYGRTPLYYAVKCGYVATAKALLKHFVSMNEEDQLLHIAVEHRGCKGVALAAQLLAAGAQLDHSNKQDETPLHKAAEQGNYMMVQFLLEAGADVNRQNCNGDTPLHKAVCFVDTNNYEQIVRILLHYGAYIDIINSKKKTPYETAISNYNVSTANIMKIYSEKIYRGRKRVMQQGEFLPLEIADQISCYATFGFLK